METANNLDEAKPIQPISTLELEVKTEDSVKYLIKITLTKIIQWIQTPFLARR